MVLKKLKNFYLNTSGNFMAITGIMIAPLFMASAAAVDYSMYKRLESRATSAAEAAMIAATQEMTKAREQDYNQDGTYDLDNDQLEAIMEATFKPFFETNLNESGFSLSGDDYELTFDEVTEIASMDLDIDYHTNMYSAFGILKMPIKVKMDINMKAEPENYVIDIVMCIDATGSMQNTIDSVQAAAQSFNDDLRAELGITATSKSVKIRTRPIFYRDWEEGRDSAPIMAQYHADYAAYEVAHAEWVAAGGGTGGGTSGLSEDEKDVLRNEWNNSSWYFWKASKNKWKKSTKSHHPKTHKRVVYEGDKFYFETMADLEDWMDTIEVAGVDPGDEPQPPEYPDVRLGLNDYGEFIDLNPNSSTGQDADENATRLENFLASEYAYGGHDWPEGAGACLNEGIRSDWWVPDSTDSKEYFDIPSSHHIISFGDEIPEGEYTKVTQVPIIVFWSDASINSLSLSQQYLSETTPTTYSDFEALWSDNTKIDQDTKMMIRFGPSSSSGWNTIKNWERYFYGGSLTTGNDEAARVIGEKILEGVPDLLRVAS